MNNQWKEIDSTSFKYQIWHKNFEEFSWNTKIDTEKFVTLIGQYKIDEDGNEMLIEKFNCINDIHEKTGNKPKSISNAIIRGKTSGGFYWKKIHNQKSISKNEEKIIEELEKNKMKGTYKGGYRMFYIKDSNNDRKCVRVHRLVFFANNSGKVTSCNICNIDASIFDIFTSPHYHIDHIDGDNKNNKIENLQRLCAKCHCQKTSKQPNNIEKKENLKLHIKILAFKQGTDEVTEYKSISDAAEKLGYFITNIAKNVREYNKNGIKKYIGTKKNKLKYTFQSVENENIEGEIWQKVPNMNGHVSNMGRVRDIFGRVSSGNDLHGYKKVVLDRRNLNVHYLVLKSFKYDELIEKAKHQKEIYEECYEMDIKEIIDSRNKCYSIDVDHIDGDSQNNNLENLRWVNKFENARNKKNVREVEQYKGGVLINTFSCANEAQRKTKISGIHMVCRNERPAAGGFQWKYKEKL